MILSKHCETFEPTTTMAIIAAVLLLATPSAAATSSSAAIGESSEQQLRGSSGRSLSALAPTKNKDRRPTLLPVSPGIAEGVEIEDLPCLVEAICEQPELSILCGFTTSYLGEWNVNGSDYNFFIGEGEGTLFAPIDSAFEDYSGSILSNILSTDLANATILENVLSYHVAPIDATSNATDPMMSLEDIECDRDLVMANGQTTTTLCFNALTKFQAGNGNRPLRTLPKILMGGMEACDGAVIMHFVDQLILPSLPLGELPPNIEEPEVPVVVPVSDEAQIEKPEVPALVPVVVGTDGCPIDRPIPNESCQDPVERCEYGHTFDGCSWGALQCVPTMTCSCATIGETGVGRWSCFINFLTKCPEAQPGPTLATLSASEAGTSPAIVKPLPSSGTSTTLPSGLCDPNKRLPSPPLSPETDCPIEPPVSFSSSCVGYPVGKSCSYGHMYLGCTWDTLSCSWTQSCSCESDGTWGCMMAGLARCGTYDDVLGFVDTTEKGLPWGEACEPNEELPTRPPIDESVDGRLSDECPSSAEFGSCAGYVPKLNCEFRHMYTGCTWGTLDCTPIMDCTCDKFGDGNWACLSMAMMRCDNTPEGHPFGKTCDPNSPLPTLPSSSTVRMSTGVMTKAKAQNEKAMSWIFKDSALP